MDGFADVLRFQRWLAKTYKLTEPTRDCYCELWALAGQRAGEVIVSAKELSGALHKDASTCRAYLDNLEAAGLVERGPAAAHRGSFSYYVHDAATRAVQLQLVDPPDSAQRWLFEPPVDPSEQRAGGSAAPLPSDPDDDPDGGLPAQPETIAMPFFPQRTAAEQAPDSRQRTTAQARGSRAQDSRGDSTRRIPAGNSGAGSPRGSQAQDTPDREQLALQHILTQRRQELGVKNSRVNPPLAHDVLTSTLHRDIYVNKTLTLTSSREGPPSEPPAPSEQAVDRLIAQGQQQRDEQARLHAEIMTRVADPQLDSWFVWRIVEAILVERKYKQSELEKILCTLNRPGIRNRGSYFIGAMKKSLATYGIRFNDVKRRAK